MGMCEYCKIVPETLGIVENSESRIFVNVSGSFLQIFDEEYPGFVDNIPIKYCPMCGRKLD